MDRLVASTVVYASRERVYDFLLDFEGYGKYSEYVRDVRTRGDGTAGTVYSITFGWWKITYTARSRVLSLTPPERIEWEITKDLDAEGEWRIESVEPPAGRDVATRVTLDVNFDPDSVGSDALDLPRLVDLDWVISKAIPLIEKQARTVLTRVVEDLEGRSRSPEVTIHHNPDSVDVADSFDERA